MKNVSYIKNVVNCLRVQTLKKTSEVLCQKRKNMKNMWL